METFANIIKLTQDDLDMSLEQLARLFNVSYMSLWMWRHAKAKPSEDSRLKIAERFKMLGYEEGTERMRRLDE